MHHLSLPEVEYQPRMQNWERIPQGAAQGTHQSQRRVSFQNRSNSPCSLPPAFQSRTKSSPCCLSTEICLSLNNPSDLLSKYTYLFHVSSSNYNLQISACLVTVVKCVSNSIPGNPKCRINSIYIQSDSSQHEKENYCFKKYIPRSVQIVSLLMI